MSLAQCSIDRLPAEIIVEVKRHLRAKSLTQLQVAEWVNGQGHNISKSAMGRYAQKLRKQDKTLRIDREALSRQDADVMALFEELALLKVREKEILAQLQAAVIPIRESQE